MMSRGDCLVGEALNQRNADISSSTATEYTHHDQPTTKQLSWQLVCAGQAAGQAKHTGMGDP
jgi:hypothetical protein